MAVAFQKTFPNLRIFDVEKAKEFYVGFLGFTLNPSRDRHETGTSDMKFVGKLPAKEK